MSPLLLALVLAGPLCGQQEEHLQAKSTEVQRQIDFALDHRKSESRFTSLNKAVALSRKLHDDWSLAISLNYLGRAFFDDGRASAAIVQYERAEAPCVNSKNDRLLVTILENRARSRSDAGHHKEAAKDAVRATEMSWIGGVAGLAESVPVLAADELCGSHQYRESLEFVRRILARYALASDVPHGTYLVAARSCLGLGRIQEAYDYCQQELRGLSGVDRVDAMREAAVCRLMLGDSKATFALLAEAKRLATEYHDRQLESLCEMDTGYAWYYLGNGKKALERYAAAEKLETDETPNEHIADRLSNEALGHVLLGDFKKAKEMILLSRAFDAAAGDPDKTAGLNNYARILIELGDYFQAAPLLERALRQAKKEEDPVSQGVTLSYMARIRSDHGEEQGAIKLYEQALGLWRSCGAKSYEPRALNGKGIALLALGALDMAASAFEEAMTVCLQTGEQRGLGIARMNRGRILVERGDYKSAMEDFRNAQSHFLEIGDLQSNAMVENSIAGVWAQERYFSLAEEVLSKALSSQTRLGDRTGQAQTLSNLSLVKFSEGKADEAVILYERAHTLWAQTGQKQADLAARTQLAVQLAKAGNGAASKKLSDLGSLAPDLDSSSLYKSLFDLARARLANQIEDYASGKSIALAALKELEGTTAPSRAVCDAHDELARALLGLDRGGEALAEWEKSRLMRVQIDSQAGVRDSRGRPDPQEDPARSGPERLAKPSGPPLNPTPLPEGKKFAVFIWCSKFDRPQYPELKSPPNDVALLKSVFAGYGFEPILIGEQDFAGFKEAWKPFAKSVGPNDEVIVWVATHSDKLATSDNSLQPFIVLRDADPTDPDTCFSFREYCSRVFHFLGCRAVVTFLDVCRAGGMIDAVAQSVSLASMQSRPLTGAGSTPTSDGQAPTPTVSVEPVRRFFFSCSRNETASDGVGVSPFAQSVYESFKDGKDVWYHQLSYNVTEFFLGRPQLKQTPFTPEMTGSPLYCFRARRLPPPLGWAQIVLAGGGLQWTGPTPLAPVQ